MNYALPETQNGPCEVDFCTEEETCYLFIVKVYLSAEEFSKISGKPYY